MKALSIRQPWAWLIVNGHKTIENRTRSLGMPTGPLLIHASQSMTNNDYLSCLKFLNDRPKLAYIAALIPEQKDLLCGGIVGMVNVNCKIEFWPGVFEETSLESQWYTGQVGYWFLNAKPLPFKPCKGQLGFFEVEA